MGFCKDGLGCLEQGVDIIALVWLSIFARMERKRKRLLFRCTSRKHVVASALGISNSFRQLTL